MKCIACGSDHVKHLTQSVSHTYKGVEIEVPNITGDFCQDCGEAYFDATNSKALSVAMQVHRDNVTHAQSFDLLRVRRRLKLKQSEAAQLFGGGATAFSRYETGKVTPPLALVQLFKLLDKHPELLNELR